MSMIHELSRLHNLQGQMALKRDWVAVGHLQALIDHMADTHEGYPDLQLALEADFQVH